MVIYFEGTRSLHPGGCAVDYLHQHVKIMYFNSIIWQRDDFVDRSYTLKLW